jgi:hypothetical protein
VNDTEFLQEGFRLTGRLEAILVDGLIPAREHEEEQQRREEDAEVEVELTEPFHQETFPVT